eukprot:SAG11_NODE_7673_length_1111_cov_27.916996_1_plen_68_part_01
MSRDHLLKTLRAVVHLKKYSFVFVEKYAKFSISNCGYGKGCFNCDVYFGSNEATQERNLRTTISRLIL